MRRLLFSILVFSAFAVFAQRPKSINFVDTLTVKDNANNAISFSKPFRALNLEEDGYFIANHDDFSTQRLGFIIMKLNADGTHRSDSIYSFNAISNYDNSFPPPVKIGNSSLFATQLDNEQPMIFALDNTNSNLLWAKNYIIDSTRRYYPTGFVADEVSGEAILYGFSSDIQSYYLPNSSFVLKIDARGNKLWSEEISFPSIDTVDHKIESAVLTDDGGVILGGNANKNNGENYLTLLKLDSNGRKVWENNFQISKLPGNADISPYAYKEAKKIIAFDDGTAALIGGYEDFMEQSKILVFTFNQSNGNINQAKKIHKQNVSTQLLDAVKDRASGGIALNYHFSSPSGETSKNFAKFDKNANIIFSTKLAESPHSFTYYYKENALINTEDDGFLTITINKDTTAVNQSPTNYFVSKLDKNFNSYCVDTLHNNLTVENINNVSKNISSIIDSTVVRVRHESHYSSTANVLSGELCKCQLSISGMVKDSMNNAIDSMRVNLYQVKSSGAFKLLDSTYTTANGTYHFDYLPEEKFIIQAESKLPNTMNTYYGQPNDFPNWDSAWVFDLDCSNQSLINKDMTLINTVPQTGPGVVKGYVFELEGFGNNLGHKKNAIEKALSDPIPGIDITLNQQPGGSAGSSITNASGGYKFTGLNLGKNYTLAADIPGLNNDSVYKINVQASNSNFDSLNFYVDSNAVYIEDDSVTGIMVYKAKDLEVSLSPNPTTKNVNLVFNANKKSELLLKTLNSNGATLLERRDFINSGDSGLELNLEPLSKGIYFMQIQLDNKVIVKKLVKE